MHDASPSFQSCNLVKQSQKCSKCHRPFYASYKGNLYCPSHLEEKLVEEKRGKEEPSE
jgi:uncharacterized Zn finger protein (UPF0148 family)